MSETLVCEIIIPNLGRPESRALYSNTSVSVHRYKRSPGNVSPRGKKAGCDTPCFYSQALGLKNYSNSKTTQPLNINCLKKQPNTKEKEAVQLQSKVQKPTIFDHLPATRMVQRPTNIMALIPAIISSELGQIRKSTKTKSWESVARLRDLGTWERLAARPALS